jgi:porin
VLVERFPGTMRLLPWLITMLTGTTLSVSTTLSAAEQIPLFPQGTGLLAGPNLLGDFGGLRSGFARHGLVLDARIIADGSLISHDGIYDQGRSYARHLLEAGLTMDIAQFVGIAGAGRITATFQSVGGDDASRELGVLQDISWLDGDGRDQFGRLFYVQPFFDESFIIKFGKDEVTKDFASNPFGMEFLNVANRQPLAAFAMPQFPDSATMALAKLDLGSWFVQAGGYDGRSVTVGKETGDDWLDIPENDFFLISEAGIEWKEYGVGHIGGIKVGYWQHSGQFPDYSGGTSDDVRGYYAQADYMLFREPDLQALQGLALWGLWSEADKDVSRLTRHLIVGALWRGLIPSRDYDAVGVSHSWLNTSRATTTADERMLELFYSCRLAGWFTLQPDVQWFVHPGGNAGAGDVFVGSLRGMLVL